MIEVIDTKTVPGAPTNDAVDAAIRGLEEVRDLLAAVQAGAVPVEAWLVIRCALADAAAHREDDEEDSPFLRDRYLHLLDELGGMPEPWPQFGPLPSPRAGQR